MGEHDVIFAGRDEVLTLSHTAYSKAIFAKGALEAAKFLAGKKPGMYSHDGRGGFITDFSRKGRKFHHNPFS